MLSINFVEFIDVLMEGVTEEHLQRQLDSGSEKFSFADVTEFSLWEGMYHNPDFMPLTLDDRSMESLDGKELIEKLKALQIITTSKNPHYDFEKKNVLDRFKGNVNEQIATESLYRRIPIHEWWVHQKFAPDKKDVQKTPYKFVQSEFLKKYFKENLCNKQVLEIGCGTGFYSFQMADYAKEVYGLDYEEEYIRVAESQMKDKGNVKFLVKNILDALTPEDFDKKVFDCIFMIDIFLFLFDRKFQPKLVECRERILSNLKRLLAPKGILFILDPHLFWLIPRLGSRDYPYGILTEYKDRHFGVIPTLEEISGLFYQTGFSIRRIIEPAVDQEYQTIDPHGYHFIKQFPQWIGFELIQNNDE